MSQWIPITAIRRSYVGSVPHFGIKKMSHRFTKEWFYKACLESQIGHSSKN